jgi:long-chain fatty acid transport protein
MTHSSGLGRQGNRCLWPASGILLLWAALLTYPIPASGLGFRIPNQDAEAIARGNAFVATADNPSAIYYNPAGITQLPGHNVHVGLLNYLGINTSYDSPGGSQSETEFEVLPVPQLHYTYTPERIPLSVGVGVYAPFGLGVEWPEDTGFRSLAIESRLQYVTINPVVAWRILPQLSLAVGPTLNYSEMELRRGLVTPLDVLKFAGSDFAVGFNAGLLWRPDSKLSLGMNYRSATTLEYEGTTSYDMVIHASAKTTALMPFPQIISAGVSFRPTTNWNFEVDVDWTDWSTLNTVTLRGTRNIFGSDLPFRLNWHSSWFFEFGASRRFGNGWVASAGYFYSTDTTSERDFSPAIPDTDLHVGSLGLAYERGFWRCALAGQIITGPPRRIANSQPNPFTGESANGGYQLFVPAVTLSLGCRF